MYEVFDHTADLGLRIRASDLNSLLADAARGLFSVLVANLDQVQSVQEKTYEVAGTEHDYLLFDWLSELLYTSANRCNHYGRRGILMKRR